MLEIERIYRDPKYTVQIVAPGLNLTFLFTGQLSISGSAEFTTLFQSARINQMKETLLKAQQVISELGGNAVGNLVNKVGVLQTINQTLAIFTGYSKPQISVQVFDLAFSKDHNPQQRLKQLLKAVFPEEISNVTVSKPFNYNPSFTNPNSTSGLVTLRISTFFKASNWFVIRNVDLSFSQEISAYGFPLYGTATITFEPYRLPSYSEVSSWFVR